MADQLHNEISSLDETYHVSARRNDSSNDYWYRRDVIEIATQLDYFADTRSYHSWLRLKISEDRQTDVIVSIHSLGVKFCGALAVTALIKFQDQSENEMTTQDGPYTLCQEVFQFTYNEKFEKITSRFSDWLDGVFLSAIDSWRRQL